MTTAASRLTKLVLAVAVAALLAADAVVVVDRRGSDKTEAASPDDRDSEEVPSRERRELEAALPDLIAFVEETRGLRFKEAPNVELLSSADFEALLRGDLEEEEEAGEIFDDEAGIGLLRALGLVEGDVDLEEVFEGQLPNILGFYDTETRVLYARGVSPSPYVKKTLVHELTHALEDQHFGILREGLDDEASPAFDALVEGSATVVEMRWYDSLSAEEQAAIDAEEEAGFEDIPADSDVEPDVFDLLTSFPYAVGPLFVEAVLAAGGNARLDAAFATPPPNTEQVLHPEKYLGGERERPVARPTADGPVIQEGRLGEVGVLLMLDTAMARGPALQAAAGWGNDGYVAWTSGAQTCVRANIVMDTTRDTTELVNALRVWARAHRGATVTGTSPVTLTRCA